MTTPTDTCKLTPEDRVCVNCRHFRRHWNFHGVMDLLFGDDNNHYRCYHNAERRELDEITGRVLVKYESLSCSYKRTNNCRNGRLWEPSKKFASRKENLFKMISQD